MEKLKLDYSQGGAVANILLDDGKGNVLDNTMMLEMLDLFTKFENNKDIKLITFQGNGKHFSFGASVPEHTKEFAEMMIKTFHSIFFRIIELGIPTMAKISGQCLGGGMELALACNFMFADKTAVLAQPEIILGVFPPPASIMLPLKIGNARAEEILISGRNIKADEGLNIGLLNQVFEDKEALDKGAEAWISNNIIPKSASSLKYAVKASRATFNYIMTNKLPYLEQLYINQLMETKDANEGINAFLEKRSPVWENC
ncbi:MAG: cyclohexa-1,5-dienecarbonyl-CoA hydratase [Bacteroidetes bacterium]|nr:MAG: cyclohexa-1,5-dienecarbonyl-CoA hydratase [Bacteroidota bacterium]MBL1145795.1 cyclohexa-1,5-dienecarbonyl-CoA hydratase [Bacteroidota bacterium]MCB0801685.1 enoyl-CoA hydratase/isomerase family protein [Flavobacteriales bacterium]NOG58589.1 cyclohexa-1,5-dienecarbonyl-CoA hydratase [Bacteroidota bacterium]